MPPATRAVAHQEQRLVFPLFLRDETRPVQGRVWKGPEAGCVLSCNSRGSLNAYKVPQAIKEDSAVASLPPAPLLDDTSSLSKTKIYTRERFAGEGETAGKGREGAEGEGESREGGGPWEGKGGKQAAPEACPRTRGVGGGVGCPEVNAGFCYVTWVEAPVQPGPWKRLRKPLFLPEESIKFRPISSCPAAEFETRAKTTKKGDIIF